VKLLLDESISDRVVQRVADLFPESAHIESVGLKEADDQLVWKLGEGAWVRDCIQRHRLPSESDCPWSPAQGDMAARRQLPDEPGHHAFEIALRDHPTVHGEQDGQFTRAPTLRRSI
jgi:hypothetical protein